MDENEASGISALEGASVGATRGISESVRATRGVSASRGVGAIKGASANRGASASAATKSSGGTKHPHGGHRQRLRELFTSEGLDALNDHQVLEILLFYGIPRKDTNVIAHRLMEHFGSLSAVMEADCGAVAKAGGITDYAAALLCMAPSLSRRYIQDRWKDKPCLDSTMKAGEYAVALFIGRQRESFHVICLDAQCRVTKSELVCEGTLNEVPIYPRSIIEAVLRHNAISVILAHNHPGGTPKPSRADIDVTARLKDALNAIAVKLVDHIVVAGCSYISLAEQGLLDGGHGRRH